MRYECKNCGKKVRKFKFLKKIKGKRYCSKCIVEIRVNHREETINKEGIREELRILKNKERLGYRKKVGREIRSYNFKGDNSPPIPKGSKIKNKISPVTMIKFQERQILFRILRKRGLDEDEAKERINELVESQKRLREELKKKNISDAEIKIKQQNIMEELLN